MKPMSNNPTYDSLRTRLGELHDLNKIGWVLGWDQRTMMAPGGGAVRADQIATLNRIAHEKFTADEVGDLTKSATSSRRSATSRPPSPTRAMLRR